MEIAIRNEQPIDGQRFKIKLKGEGVLKSAKEERGCGAILGEIRLLPFRAKILPAGWYMCNGQRVLGEAEEPRG